MPTVSLVIPCFNAAPFLAAALNSALDQTRRPDEIIVVDDGSTDNSAVIAESIDGPLSVLRIANSGIAAARNTGIKSSIGAIIAFLDADDLWTPGSLQGRLAFWSQRPELDYVYGSVACFDDTSGAPIGQPEPGRLAGSVLVKRAAFDAIGPFDTSLRTGETIDWIGRADAAGYRSACTGDVALRRRVHTSNTTRDSAQLHADYLKILRNNLTRRG